MADTRKLWIFKIIHFLNPPFYNMAARALFLIYFYFLQYGGNFLNYNLTLKSAIFKYNLTLKTAIFKL